MQSAKNYDVLVLGAGPAGVMAAARATELGARVCLVARGRCTGMLPNDGPVPVRTLAYTARLMRDAGQLARYGVEIEPPELNYSNLLERVGQVTQNIRESSDLFERISLKDTRVYEEAGNTWFVDSNTVITESGLWLSADRFVICTGVVSKKLQIPGIEFTSSHSDAWSLAQVPESILVVGGCATGIQVASIFNAFGSRIYLFESGPRILQTEDADTAAAVTQAFSDAGMHIREGFGSIESFEKTRHGVKMNFSKNGCRASAEATLAVVAEGWEADAEALNLSTAGVEITSGGFIRVDTHLRTSARSIFAAGDATGRLMLASDAMREGFIAGTNAVQGPQCRVGLHPTPAGSFTDPEYASVGLTEAKARETHDVDCVVVNFTESVRAVIDGQTFGFCKLIIDSQSHEILGCHVVGERAIEIAQIAAAVLSAGMRRVDDLARLSVSFPTYAQILIHAAVKATLEHGLDASWHGSYR